MKKINHYEFSYWCKNEKGLQCFSNEIVFKSKYFILKQLGTKELT